MGPIRPLFCQYCGQTIFTDQVGVCSACGERGGLVEPTEAEALDDLLMRKQLEPDPSVSGSLREIRDAGSMLGAMRFFVGGIAIFFMGIWLLAISDGTMKDAAPGVGAMVVGGFLVAVVVLPWFLGDGSHDRK